MEPAATLSTEDGDYNGREQKLRFVELKKIDLFRCAQRSLLHLEKGEPLTGAMKRYPRRASVSMTLECPQIRPEHRATS